MLKEQLAALSGGKKPSFTARQRRRLAEAGKVLTPDERRQCCQLVKRATILAWFRQIAARKHDSSKARRGRPGKPEDVRKLVVEMAMANLNWATPRSGMRCGRGWRSRSGVRRSPTCWPRPASSRRRSARRSERGSNS